MKAILLGALMVCLSNCTGHKPVVPTETVRAENFGHRLFFKSGPTPRFVATLTNLAHERQSLRVNPKDFHATFKIQRPNGLKLDAFESEYLDMLLTAIWTEPLTTLKPGECITWVVPLSRLRTLQVKPTAILQPRRVKDVSAVIPVSLVTPLSNMFDRVTNTSLENCFVTSQMRVFADNLGGITLKSNTVRIPRRN